MQHITTRLVLVTLLVLAAMTIFGGYTRRVRSLPMDIELTPRSNAAGPGIPQRP